MTVADKHDVKGGGLERWMKKAEEMYEKLGEDDRRFINGQDGDVIPFSSIPVWFVFVLNSSKEGDFVNTSVKERAKKEKAGHFIRQYSPEIICLKHDAKDVNLEKTQGKIRTVGKAESMKLDRIRFFTTKIDFGISEENVFVQMEGAKEMKFSGSFADGTLCKVLSTEDKKSTNYRKDFDRVTSIRDMFSNRNKLMKKYRSEWEETAHEVKLRRGLNERQLDQEVYLRKERKRLREEVYERELKSVNKAKVEATEVLIDTELKKYKSTIVEVAALDREKDRLAYLHGDEDNSKGNIEDGLTKYKEFRSLEEKVRKSRISLEQKKLKYKDIELRGARDKARKVKVFTQNLTKNRKENIDEEEEVYKLGRQIKFEQSELSEKELLKEISKARAKYREVKEIEMKKELQDLKKENVRLDEEKKKQEKEKKEKKEKDKLK